MAKLSPPRYRQPTLSTLGLNITSTGDIKPLLNSVRRKEWDAYSFFDVTLF